MKNPGFFSLLRRNYIPVLVNAILAIAFTVISFQYVEPMNCYRLCGTENGSPCPTGSCNFGEQKAGWPIPVFVDAPGGGSPTGGWGLLGPEDLPLPIPMILDVLFYSFLLWPALYLIRVIQRQASSYRLVLVSVLLNIFFAASLWLFYMLFAYSVPVGRGTNVQVFVNTPTSTTASPAFLPIVVISLGELVETYGSPDYVRFTAEDMGKVPKISSILYWRAAEMFVILPEVTNESYAIQENSGIQMIIFAGDKEVISIDDKLLGEKEIPWHGYGDYHP
jgi:hypothetical protein